MVTFISHNPAETARLGETWGSAAEPGSVIGLCGDLGSGKTQLVKGLAKGLGCTDRVHSPTFSLINVYSGGRLPLFHLDLYRLETREQILKAGLEEYLHSAGLTVIEWADRWFGTLDQQEGSGVSHGRPRLFRWVTLESLSDTERRICYEDPGA